MLEREIESAPVRLSARVCMFHRFVALVVTVILNPEVPQVVWTNSRLLGELAAGRLVLLY